MQNRFLKPPKPPEIKRVEKYDDDDEVFGGIGVGGDSGLQRKAIHF